MSAVQSAVSNVQPRKGRAPVMLRSGVTLRQARENAKLALSDAKADLRSAKKRHKEASVLLTKGGRNLVKVEKAGDKAMIRIAKGALKLHMADVKKWQKQIDAAEKTVAKAQAAVEKVENAPRKN